MEDRELWEAVIIGGGPAGLSAAIYLGRALRRTLLIDSGHSMAVWEPHVENYLGFPEGIAGEELLRLGRSHARRFHTEFRDDVIEAVTGEINSFTLEGREAHYHSRRVLLATGIFHIPPEIPSLDACLGRSMFFCKDCDGYRVQNQRVGIVGRNNEAVDDALSMLTYTPNVFFFTDAKKPAWDEQHDAWLKEYSIPVHQGRIDSVEHQNGLINAVVFKDSQKLNIDVLFTARGDIVHNRLAKTLGAKLDETGQVIVDEDFRTSVPGIYAAGCVTPANCQIIIAAGQGASAAQAINHDLSCEARQAHSLPDRERSQGAYASST